MYKYDMHCHTKEGSMDGRVPILEVASILKEKGFSGVLVSDHNSYKGFRAWRDAAEKIKDFVVLKGIEYDTIDAGHILCIMPRGVKLKILELRGLPASLLIEIVHRHGGILGPAHPCGERYLSFVNTMKMRNQLHVMDKFDFVEAFNACEDEESNADAAKLASVYHKPGFGGSDSHREDCLGMAYTGFEEHITSEDELIDYLKDGKAVSCGGSRYNKTTKDKLGKANNLLVQGFWFYNRFGSMWRHRRRKNEMHQLDLTNWKKKRKY